MRLTSREGVAVEKWQWKWERRSSSHQKSANGDATVQRRGRKGETEGSEDEIVVGGRGARVEQMM